MGQAYSPSCGARYLVAFVTTTHGHERYMVMARHVDQVGLSQRSVKA